MNTNSRSALSAFKNICGFPVLIMALLFAVAQLSGCTGSSVGEINQLDDMGAADMHRVQTDQLKGIMRKMNSVIYEREYTAMDIDEERVRRASEIAQIVTRMSQEVTEVGKTQLYAKLDKAEREMFAQYAEELAKHGKALQEVSASERARAFVPAMNKMVQTCNACHDRFRSM